MAGVQDMVDEGDDDAFPDEVETELLSELSLV